VRWLPSKRRRRSAGRTGCVARCGRTPGERGGGDLSGANLNGSILTGANLNDTDLSYAGLGEGKLAGAVLTGARYNGYTCWPSGFDPQKHGARRVESRD
jgi:hypothetical protein